MTKRNGPASLRNSNARAFLRPAPKIFLRKLVQKPHRQFSTEETMFPSSLTCPFFCSRPIGPPLKADSNCRSFEFPSLCRRLFSGGVSEKVCTRFFSRCIDRCDQLSRKFFRDPVACAIIQVCEEDRGS